MTAARYLSPAERAANGAQLLDQHSPGWAAQISLDLLNISDCKVCVLGQLYGAYQPSLMGLDMAGAVAMGFHPRASSFPAVVEYDSELLTEAWAAEISKRRQPPGALLDGLVSSMERHLMAVRTAGVA